MAKNQNMLIGIIIALVIVIGALAYHNYQRPQTLGEKVGAAVEQAGDDIENAADDVKREAR
ncbi:MAG TPA: hypothetical protein VEF76_07515 [Patescibacteria group bacterium]|nr:hypothetical protein [Patescibacteria group bacterium]